MGKNLPCVTPVLLAVHSRIMLEMQSLFRKTGNFQVVSPSIKTRDDLLNELDKTRPDILVLDMTLPVLNAHEVLITLGAREIRPYVVVTAPHHKPYLIGIQRYPIVRAALIESLALSPLLRHVLTGIAEGCQYFAASPPEPVESDFSRDDLVLLALMVIGVENFAARRELGWARDKIYHGQRRLRQKLGATTSAQVVAFAIRQGLVGVLTEPPDQGPRQEVA